MFDYFKLLKENKKYKALIWTTDHANTNHMAHDAKLTAFICVIDHIQGLGEMIINGMS